MNFVWKYLENCSFWCKLHENQILIFEDIAMAAILNWVLMVACIGSHFEINTKTENNKTQFISQSMHTHTHLMDVIFVYHVNNHFMGKFYAYCTFIMHYWKKINIHCELMMSQPRWFSGSHLDISKLSIVNNFLVYSPICMKFSPNCLVSEILSVWLWFNCFQTLSSKWFWIIYLFLPIVVCLSLIWKYLWM